MTGGISPFCPGPRSESRSSVRVGARVRDRIGVCPAREMGILSGVAESASGLCSLGVRSQVRSPPHGLRRGPGGPGPGREPG